MSEPCPACGSDDPALEEIFQRAISHVLDFAEAAIRETWQHDGASIVDIPVEWYDALVEGLLAGTTEIAFHAGSENAAQKEEIAEILHDMLASHVEAALADPADGSMVQ